MLELLILAAVGLWVFFALRHTLRKKGGCCGTCSGCSGCTKQGNR